MSRNKIILTVIVTVIVVGALAAGGYALYRLGYAHGQSGTTAGVFGENFGRNFGDRFMPEFRDRFSPEFHRDAMPMFSYRQPLGGFSFFRIIPGFLLVTGVVALAAFGLFTLIRKRDPSTSQPASIQTDISPIKSSVDSEKGTSGSGEED